MNTTVEQVLISKLRTLSPQQVAEVADFVEFLATKSRRLAALDRLPAIAPALEAAGVEPMSGKEITAEVQAAREERAAAGARLGESIARLDALNLPPLSDEEIATEIQAAREQRAARRA